MYLYIVLCVMHINNIGFSVYNFLKFHPVLVWDVGNAITNFQVTVILRIETTFDIYDEVSSWSARLIVFVLILTIKIIHSSHQVLTDKNKRLLFPLKSED